MPRLYKFIKISILFLPLILLKIIIFFSIGFIIWPDSIGYEQFADIILKTNAWLYSVNFKSDWQDVTAFRSIGYPLFIALSKYLFPGRYYNFIVIFQNVLSLIATYIIYSCAIKFTKSIILSYIVAFGFFTANLDMDFSILTDSIYNSLYAILLLYISMRTIEFRRLSILEMISLGAILSITIIIRDSGVYFSILVCVMFLINMMLINRSVNQRIFHMAIFLMPVVIVFITYNVWNYYRSGNYFLTTSTQTALLLTEVLANKQNCKMFLDNTPFDIVACQEIKKNLRNLPIPIGEWPMAMPTIDSINRRLHQEYSFNQAEISKMVKKKFFSSIIKTPLPYLQNMFIYFKEALKRSFLPLKKMQIFFGETKGKYDTDILKHFASFYIKMRTDADLFFATLYKIELLGSYVLPFFFLVGFPISCCFINQSEKGVWLVLSGLWFSYVGMVGLYSLIHWEPRYTVGVSAAYMLVSVMTARRFYQALVTKYLVAHGKLFLCVI